MFEHDADLLLKDMNKPIVHFSRPLWGRVAPFLFDKLAHNPNVTTLCLSMNHQYVNDEQQKQLVDMITSMPNLKVLKFHLKNTCATIAKFVESNPPLEFLDVTVAYGMRVYEDMPHMMPSSMASEKIVFESTLAQALLSNTNLKHLVISDASSVTPYVTALLTNTTLETLHIKDCATKCTDMQHEVEAMAAMLRINTTLKCLHLDACHFIDDFSVSILVEALRDNHTLETLSLRENSITTRGATELATLMAERALVVDISNTTGENLQCINPSLMQLIVAMGAETLSKSIYAKMCHDNDNSSHHSMDLDLMTDVASTSVPHASAPNFLQKIYGWVKP